VDLAPLQLDKEEWNAINSPLCSTPYFIGHGTADEKVSVSLRQQMRGTLTQLGLNVTWKEYEDQGHWYKVPDELDDIASFLRDGIGIP